MFMLAFQIRGIETVAASGILRHVCCRIDRLLGLSDRSHEIVMLTWR